MQKIRKILKNVLKLLENYLSLVILVIFVIIILYASWVLYSFVYRSISKSPEVSFEEITIKKVVLDRIVGYIDAREQNISEAIEKEYRDVFK